MNLDQAIDQACNSVAIVPPRDRRYGKWLLADTLSGRNGKGDGRVMLHEDAVTAWNWQTGERVTVCLNEDSSPQKMGEVRRRIRAEQDDRRKNAARAADFARRLVDQAVLGPHPYLIGKGFSEEKVLTVRAEAVASIAGNYLVPAGAQRAVIVPVRRGELLTAQLIWEDGTKKFLFGGSVSGGSHRVASGAETWLCEGLATGLSLRTALRGLSRSATILCCLSAANIAAVAANVAGRCLVAVDHDKPLSQYGGSGAGQYFGACSRKPFVQPPIEGDDFNDLHLREGIFAVQRVLSAFLMGVPMG